MSLSPLWTRNTPLALTPSIGELQHLCWEGELKCARGHTGIGELGWNWTSRIVGIILSIHHKGIVSFISVSKAILANKNQLCYILLMIEPPDWVKNCNAFNSPAHLTATIVYRWGLDAQESSIFLQIKRIFLTYLCQHCLMIALSFFQPFKCLISLMSRCGVDYHREHFLSFCTRFWSYTTPCSCFHYLITATHVGSTVLEPVQTKGKRWTRYGKTHMKQQIHTISLW